MSSMPLIETSSVVIDPSSVVLVSGGAKGITARCVVALAQRSQAKFILLGRSPAMPADPDWAEGCTDGAELKKRIMENLVGKGQKPTPALVQRAYRDITGGREIRDTLDAVRRAGGYAEYVQVDVADAGALKNALVEPVQRLGDVTGVIHGAGALADKLIEKKTGEDFETVYSPKIKGLESLLSVARVDNLRFLVLFSSIVGFYGNAGQADYAIANEILNKSAYLIKRQNPACRVVSINWGPWEMGMVTPELKRAFEARGISVIPADSGAELLVEELAPSNGKNVQVIVGTPLAQAADEIDPTLHQHQIRRRLRLQDNPFLYDHVIGGNPVLPATCAAAWVANACEQLYPGYRFLHLENYHVLKGIVFDGQQAEEYTLDLKEIEKTPGQAIVFEALVSSKAPNGRARYHYTLQVKLVRNHPQAPVLPLQIPQEKAIPGPALYANGTLFHGPAFQGVQQVLHLSQGRLMMACVLPEVNLSSQGQFPVQTSNPYIYDAIVQSVLIWAQYMYGAPCLPAGLGRLEQFKPIPFGQPVYVSMDVTSQSNNLVRGNIVVQDETGMVYVRITNLEGTISRELNRYIGVQPNIHAN